ncbi:beta-galactosidase [Brachybacterium huguangmaarense]
MTGADDLRETDPMSTAPILRATPDGFLRDGEPDQIVSGALHYFRVHPDQWRDRLRRLVALGCHTVETYVAWNIHQPAPGTTTFEGIADLGRFLDLAAEEGLDAIVRPGPYICAEWENGGFPGWILRDRSMRLRCSDPAYLALVDAWFDVLIPVIARRQASRGGNVVMVQVENEYGSYGDDTAYLEHLRDGLRARGIDEMLVTSDGPARMWLTGGRVDGALATVNFGSRTDDVLAMAAEELPDQPLMCMEFWNGWFDHWGEEHHDRTAESAAEELETMLAAGMSVNVYMAHGGTNYGMTAGANAVDGILQPTTTSYDYDAPIAEDGALTEKFRAFREVIARHRELPPLEEHLASLGLEATPAHVPERAARIEGTAPLRALGRWTAGGDVHVACPSFEDLGLERGLVLYRRTIEVARTAEGGIAPLRLYDLRDRAWAFVHGHRVGPLAATGNPQVAAVIELNHLADALLPDGAARADVTLEVLVENLGRTNFGPMLGERKGIVGGIWQTIRFLSGIEATGFPLEEMGAELAEHARGGDAAGDDALPLVVAASFEIDEHAADGDGPADAWLDVSGCGHGVAYVNGFCVGRYWEIGPQQTLYVPAPVLRAGRNEVTLLELERADVSLAIADGPVFGTRPTEGAAA